MCGLSGESTVNAWVAIALESPAHRRETVCRAAVGTGLLGTSNSRSKGCQGFVIGPWASSVSPSQRASSVLSLPLHAIPPPLIVTWVAATFPSEEAGRPWLGERLNEATVTVNVKE